MASGHTNGQIGRPLGVSEGTVRKHLENIYDRLQVSSRTAAVGKAFQTADSCLSRHPGNTRPSSRPGPGWPRRG